MALLDYTRRAMLAAGTATAIALSAISVTAQTPDDVLVVGQIALMIALRRNRQQKE